MLGNPVERIFIGVPVAAGVVFGLFSLMNNLIVVEEVTLEEKEQRVLDVITPQENDQNVTKLIRGEILRIESTDKPPPPPEFKVSKASIDLPALSINGSAPAEVVIQTVGALTIAPVAISDRDATPIRPPVLNYPARALQGNIEGDCDVSFNVDVRGRPYDVDADCTSSLFEREALRAVRRVEFAPKIVRGQPAERRNVVYPITFRLPDN